MKFLYSLSFLLGADNWKIHPTPEELTRSLGDFAKEKVNILDLGCGDGHDCITLALEGWKVIGVDFVSLAIRKAKTAAQKAGVAEKVTFMVGDVCKLDQLNLPTVDIAYDIGCFHLLNQEQAQGYISGLANVVRKDGLFILKAFVPREQRKKTVGYEAEAIEEMFNPYFKVERTSDHSYWRFPARWYWMRK